MKITKDRLTQMIREAVIRIAERDDGEDEAEGAEVATDETEDILERLKDILEKWSDADYASETDRWQDYAEDIQSLVNEYKGEDTNPKRRKIKTGVARRAMTIDPLKSAEIRKAAITKPPRRAIKPQRAQARTLSRRLLLAPNPKAPN